MALIKVACSLCPAGELGQCLGAIDWLMQRTDAAFTNLPVLYAFTPGPIGAASGEAVLLRRKHESHEPYLWCLVQFGNHRFQVFVPFCPADGCWFKPNQPIKVTTKHFPSRFGPDWPFGPTKFGVLDWSGRDLVRTDTKVTFHVERATVTDVRSDKIRYDENETATTAATIVNQTGAAAPATLVAKMIVDLDKSREIAQTAMTLEPGENKWSFSYSVGPETYGRAVEVRCLSEKGKLLDRWQEYYPVAAEWFRVQVPCGAPPLKSYKTDPWVTYQNQNHEFASEPTDFGPQIHDCEEYLSGAANYHVNVLNRNYRFTNAKKLGIMTTLYQNNAYSGQMGYELIRQHPEFALYDANSQLAVDPVLEDTPTRWRSPRRSRLGQSGRSPNRTWTEK